MYSRRKLLSCAVTTAGVAPFSGLMGRRLFASEQLRPDPKQLLDLPDGFSYTVLQHTGDLMSDGYAVAGRPDGMGCFVDEQGHYVLMRNHELTDRDDEHSPYTSGRRPPPEAYDADELGGVSRIVIDRDSLNVLESNLVLAGTVRNCNGGYGAGGWYSCEETFSSRHGYVFWCDPSADSVRPPRLVREFGKFLHEAAATDPASGITYLTEDQSDGCFYRHTPGPSGGRLQALRVLDRPRYRTDRLMNVGDVVEVDWVDVRDVDPRRDIIRLECQDIGAAIFNRGEGLWLMDGDAYFASTSGGPVGKGQIFRYHPTGLEEGALELITQSQDRRDLNMPDSLTISPTGSIYLGEDGVSGDQCIRILDGDRVRLFARDNSGKYEMAGLCFSPDGRVLFVNLMSRTGYTLAITGPFSEI